MYNFDPYNVLLAIATNIPPATYDCFCAPGSYSVCYIRRHEFTLHLLHEQRPLQHGVGSHDGLRGGAQVDHAGRWRRRSRHGPENTNTGDINSHVHHTSQYSALRVMLCSQT